MALTWLQSVFTALFLLHLYSCVNSAVVINHKNTLWWTCETLLHSVMWWTEPQWLEIYSPAKQEFWSCSLWVWEEKQFVSIWSEDSEHAHHLISLEVVKCCWLMITSERLNVFMIRNMETFSVLLSETIQSFGNQRSGGNQSSNASAVKAVLWLMINVWLHSCSVRRTGLLDVTQLHTDRKRVSGTHPSEN